MAFRSLTLKDSDAQLEFWNQFIPFSQNPHLKGEINLEFLKNNKNHKNFFRKKQTKHSIF